MFLHIDRKKHAPFCTIWEIKQPTAQYKYHRSWKPASEMFEVNRWGGFIVQKNIYTFCRQRLNNIKIVVKWSYYNMISMDGFPDQK